MSKIKILRDYDSRYVLPPTGRQNNGVICYFNALDAILKSIPIFNKAMMNIQEHETNPLAFCTIYAKEIIKYLEATPGTIITNTSLVSILKTTIKNHEENQHENPSNISNTLTRPFHLDLGQCDASEAFIKTIEVLGETYPSIQKIFQYRYTEEIRCDKCKKTTKKKILKRTVHDMHKFKKAPHEINSNHDLFVYNLMCSLNIIEDYSCPICNGWKKSHDDPNDLEPSNPQEKNNVIKTKGLISQTLNLVPEVLAINLISQYTGAVGYSGNTILFPLNFRLNKKVSDPSQKEEYIYYKLVGQIHKSGNTKGGHYWARCLRKGMVYEINDSSLSESEFKPISNTTMIFYHHFIPTESDPFIIEHDD